MAEIVHHVALAVDEDIRDAFSKLQIELEVGYKSFDISEDDPRWPAVSLLVKRFDAGDIARSKFTIDELNNAAYLDMVSSWHNGYPEPSDGGYRVATFDLTDFCESCGMGLRQIRPFRFKKEPVWGRRSIMRLYWIQDEIFVKPEVWANIFKPFGIECLPVVLDKSGKQLDTVVQLDIPSLCEMDMDDFAFEICSVCHRKRYLYIHIGFYPRPVQPKEVAFKSTQYVGSGGAANRLLVVSQSVYQRVTSAGLQGARFYPCKA